MSATQDHDVYEETQDLIVSADEAFAFLSDLGNLPKYLPPITSAHLTEGDEVELEGQAPTGDTFSSSGYFRVDEAAQRMEWGAQASRAYSGWLTVADNGENASSVTVHVEFGPRSVVAPVTESDEGDQMTTAVLATLETIRRQVEGEGGQVEPPPPPSREQAEAAREIAAQRPDIRTES